MNITPEKRLELMTQIAAGILATDRMLMPEPLAKESSWILSHLIRQVEKDTKENVPLPEVRDSRGFKITPKSKQYKKRVEQYDAQTKAIARACDPYQGI